MLSINTNLASFIAQRSMKQSTNALNQAIERMTTGFKINHAKDNAANYNIATNMTTKIGALQVAEDNCAMGLDMITTASDTLSGIDDKLVRLRSLATQASNGTYGTQSLNAINTEANALVDEIARLYSTAEYNGIKLFSDTSSTPAPIMATFAIRARAASFGYSDEEIAEMTTLTEAFQAGAFVEGEIYSISSVDELEKFRDMVNAGNRGAGSTFVLTKDLNLSGISNWTPIGNDFNNVFIFSGVFDGNGHVISNLKINDTSGGFQGLFGIVGCLISEPPAEIKNLGLEEVNINGGTVVGALVAIIGTEGTVNISNNYSTGTVSGFSIVGGLVGGSESGGTINITNNYSTATVSAQDESAGGLIGTFYNEGITDLENNFVTGDVSGTNGVGGLVGNLIGSNGDLNITNNFATGSVTGSTSVGGLIGECTGSPSPTIINCASVQADNYVAQKSKNEILAPANLESMGFSAANGWTIKNGLPVHNFKSTGGGSATTTGSNPISLQVGIGANSDSQINLDLGFSLGTVDDLRMIGLDTTTDFLDIIDEMIATVSAKQIEYGAAQNRLESALDEISTQHENLVSSRSTLRDADIADISSEYIRQQILQQASATLMSTANQSASIALSLI